MKLSIISFVALVACAGCFNATVSDNATITKQVNLPVIPIPPGVVPHFQGTVDATTTLDASGAFKDIAKVGTLSLSFPSDTFTGDVGWVSHIKLTLASSDGTMPEMALIDQDVSNTQTEIDVVSKMDDATLQAYLTEGSLNLHVWASGWADEMPLNGATMNWSVTANASVSGSKSIGDLGSLGK